MVLLVASTDRLLMFLLPRRAKIGHETPKVRSGLASLVSSRPLGAGGFMTGGVALFAAMLVFWLVRPAAVSIPLRASGTTLDLAEATLTEEIAGWKRSGFEVIEREPGNINGEVTYKWTFKRGGLESTLAIDGPFGTWHDLGKCYAAAGWNVTEGEDIRLDLPGEKVIGLSLIHI